jgi:Na+/alanine symporter
LFAGFYYFGRCITGVQANSVADGIQNAFEIDIGNQE